MKCANCSDDAVYVDIDPGAVPRGFCTVHLPEYLVPRVAAGTIQVL